MHNLILWMAGHPTITVSLFLLTAFAVLNLLAYRHARTMTHFAALPRGLHGIEDWRDRSHPLSLFGRLRLAFNGVTLERPHQDIGPDRVNLPCEVHTFAGEVGRLAAWYIPHEKALGLVVIFHGYAASKAQLLPEARAFHDLGYACFLVDFRGSGDSDGDCTSIGYHEADDVERTVAYVREQWPAERLILFGQSMGAASVLRALSRRSLQPDAVVLECPFDRLLSTVEARFALMGLPSFPGARLMVFWGGLQHGFNGFTHNPVEYAARVACPTLLLHGTRDTRVSCQQIESIHQNLGGEKQLHYFEGAGHESYAALRPEEWKECVARFLQGRSRVTAMGRK